MSHVIYLDYAATSPVDPRVLDVMLPYLHFPGDFGNPSSQTHLYGFRANAAVETAREQVAACIHAQARDIVWTSGATESNNLAIKGAVYFSMQHNKKPAHIITIKTEHKAVLDTCEYLEQQGCTVTYLTPDRDGRVQPSMVEQAIQDNTVLVSIMHGNNEVGVLQNLVALGAMIKSHSILFHVDAAQSAGKVPIDVDAMSIDLLSLASHKIYGPKGIGALYVRHKPRVRLVPLIHGGGHENGMRSGTLPTHQIVGMGAAYALAQAEMMDESKRVAALRDQLWLGLSALPDVYRHGSTTHCLPGILNVSFSGIDSEALMMGLPHLALSTGSACNSAAILPSHVLQALGVPDRLIQSVLRFSLGRFTTEQEIEQVIAQVTQQVQRLRQFSPFWGGL